MNGQAIHASGVNWQSVLTLVTLIGGVLAGCAAFLARTIRGARRFIGHQVIEGTEQIAGQVAGLNRRTSVITWAGLAGVIVIGTLAAGYIAGDAGRRNRTQRGLLWDTRIIRRQRHLPAS